MTTGQPAEAKQNRMVDRDADLPAVMHAKHAGHQVGQGVVAKVRGNVANA